MQWTEPRASRPAGLRKAASVVAGLAVPTATPAGARLSLIVSGTMYNVDR